LSLRALQARPSALTPKTSGSGERDGPWCRGGASGQIAPAPKWHDVIACPGRWIAIGYERLRALDAISCHRAARSAGSGVQAPAEHPIRQAARLSGMWRPFAGPPSFSRKIFFRNRHCVGASSASMALQRQQAGRAEWDDGFSTRSRFRLQGA